MHDLYPSDMAALDRAALEQAVQRRAQTVYLGGGVALSRILTRYKLLLHTSDQGFARHVMMDGYWEIWLTQFFARTLRPGMRIIDVGANYGYYTMLFADIAAASGQVIAIEPNPAAVDLLRQSVRLNGFDGTVRVIDAALGSAPGITAELIVPPGEPKNAYLCWDPRADGLGQRVALTTLDDVSQEAGPVDFIKIDAEGSEQAIIAGMPNVLERDRPAMVLEFNTKRCDDPGALLDRLVSVYGGAAAVGFDGTAVPVDRDTVLTTQVGLDWLLYFTAASA